MTDNVDKELQELREEESHGNRLDKDNPQNQPDFVDTLERTLQASDDGDLSENLTAYDPRMVALMEGLDQEGELEAVFDDLQTAYDGDAGVDDPSRSAVVKLAFRVGLQEGTDDILDDLQTAVERRETTTI